MSHDEVIASYVLRGTCFIYIDLFPDMQHHRSDNFLPAPVPCHDNPPVMTTQNEG